MDKVQKSSNARSHTAHVTPQAVGHGEQLKTKLRGLRPQANYTDRATAAYRRS
jgi:hypothetical protein